MSARRIPLGAWRVLGMGNPRLRLAMLAILGGLGLSLGGAVPGDTQTPIQAAASLHGSPEPLRGSPDSRALSPNHALERSEGSVSGDSGLTPASRVPEDPGLRVAPARMLSPRS